VSHPFGDLVSQHLHRKHGLSQSKLAAGILQAPSIITAMCKGRRLTGPQARERVVAIIGWLHAQGALDTLDEANALLDVAGMSNLNGWAAAEVKLAQMLRPSPGAPSSSSKTTPRHNLPAPATSLIGRADDIAAARALLSRDDVRLVAFLGPPGVGKTRLALRVAWDVRDEFADGVWFVPLASVSDAQLVASAIVQALDLPNVSAPPLVLLRNHLRDQQLLLVLDNFEQLLDATTIVAELLASAPSIKILTTSRAALLLSGEHLLEVQPLAELPAVELFVQRAQAIKPGFALSDGNAQTVAEICRRLDGLPLAIELAAARVRMFDPAQLLARLSSRLDLLTSHAQDLPARQRTLRGTIEWSYNLLVPEEQTLFRRLSIFAGGCSLEAAERVAGDGLQTPILDLLWSLADKSLIKLDVVDNEMRISLLETLREYALAQLTASGESDALFTRHTEFYVRHFEAVGDIGMGANWMDRAGAPALRRRLDREAGNWRAALAYARQTEDVESLSHIVIAPMTQSMQISPESGGWLWLADLFAKPHKGVSPLMRAKALRNLASILSSDVSNLALSWTMFEESAQIFGALGEARERAKCLVQLTVLAWLQGKFEIGKQHGQCSVEILEHEGDDAAFADARQWLGAIARDQGQFDIAHQLFNQSLMHFRRSQNLVGQGLTLNGLGDLAFDRGDYAEALVCCGGAQRDWREFGLYPNFALRTPARIAYQQDNPARADELLSVCVAELRLWENSVLLSFALHHLGIAKHLLGGEVGMSLLREALTIQHRALHRLQISESLERFAWIAADTHQPERAARLFGAADALRKWMGAPLPLGDKPLYDRYLEMAHAALDSDAFGQAWAEGAGMTLDQAVAYALAENN
jgi:predicted ATPase